MLVLTLSKGTTIFELGVTMFLTGSKKLQGGELSEHVL
jgi:hypothetical protein